VRLEHLMRKYLPEVPMTPPAPLELVVGFELETEADDNTEADEVGEAVVNPGPPKMAMGKVASSFVEHPAHADLLLGMGVSRKFYKMVVFRNYLIHGANTQFFTAGKLKKSYVMLQHLLYFMKRWPYALALHGAINALIQEWFSLTGQLGPPAPPSFLLSAQRNGRSREVLMGLLGEDAESLVQALGMLVTSDPPQTPDSITALTDKIRSIRPRYFHDATPSA
jgi:hypothetical protein